MNTDASNVRSTAAKVIDRVGRIWTGFIQSAVPERFRATVSGVPASLTNITQERVTQIIEHYHQLTKWLEQEIKRYQDLQKLVEIVECPAQIEQTEDLSDANKEQFTNVAMSKTSEFIFHLIYYKSFIEDIGKQYVSIKNAFKKIDKLQNDLAAMKEGGEAKDALKKYIARSNGAQIDAATKSIGIIQKEMDLINQVACSDVAYLLGTIATILKVLDFNSTDVDALIGTRPRYLHVSQPDLDGYA